MAITGIPSQPKVKPADIPLEKLVHSKSLTEQEKTREGARQFEAVLVRQILTEAQKPAIQSKFNMTGASNSIYQDMMVNQMADTITSSHSLGLSQQLEAQMTRQLKIKSPGAAAAKPGQAPGAPAAAAAQSISKTISESSTNRPSGPPVHPTKAPGPRS